MLLKALPGGIAHFGTTVTSVEQQEGSSRARVTAERRKPGQQDGAEKEPVLAEADLVIAADGQMSDTRRKFVPTDKRRHALGSSLFLAFVSSSFPPFAHCTTLLSLCFVRRFLKPMAFCSPFVACLKAHALLLSFRCMRMTCNKYAIWALNEGQVTWIAARRYSGYCAWRGVVTDEEAPEAAAAARRAYEELGHAIYFDISVCTHGVLYELPGQRLNWLWYACCIQ